MTKFLDFAALKEAVTFSDAVDHLGLKLKHSGNQFRGPCPTCVNAGERALVVTEAKGFYCWGERRGGDVIALAAHILELPAKEAAVELAERAGLYRDSTSTSDGTVPRNKPESETVKETQKLQPLSYLEFDHDAIIALGFDPEKAKALGIGFAPRGVVRGSVAIPIRDEAGTLIGYVGVQDLTYIAPDFTTNVVALKRRA